MRAFMESFGYGNHVFDEKENKTDKKCKVGYSISKDKFHNKDNKKFEARQCNLNDTYDACEDLPDMCYVAIASDSYGDAGIGIIRKGEMGYYKTDLAETNKCKGYAGCKGLVKELNKRLEVSEKEAKCMEIGSMFGWDVPGANLNNYDENGKFRKFDESKETDIENVDEIEDEDIINEALLDNALNSFMNGFNSGKGEKEKTSSDNNNNNTPEPSDSFSDEVSDVATDVAMDSTMSASTEIAGAEAAELGAGEAAETALAAIV